MEIKQTANRAYNLHQTNFGLLGWVSASQSDSPRLAILAANLLAGKDAASPAL
jgi:hypothetical protein